MRAIKTREKHDDQVIVVETDEALGKAALAILTERMRQGWYPEPYADEERARYDETFAMLQIAKTDQTRRDLERKLERIKRDIAEAENHDGWYAEAKRVVDEQDAGVLEKSKRIGRSWVLYGADSHSPTPVAWQLLRFRADCEYEWIELTSIREVRA